MTRAELHSIQGFHAPTLLAAAALLRSAIPRNRHAGDATAIIKNEGHMNGFLDAIEALEYAALPKAPETEKKAFQPYANPQSETPNKK